MQAYLIGPLLFSRRLTLNPVALFVGLAFWWWIWGIAGAFVAVPLLATFKIFCDHIDVARADRRVPRPARRGGASRDRARGLRLAGCLLAFRARARRLSASGVGGSSGLVGGFRATRLEPAGTGLRVRTVARPRCLGATRSRRLRPDAPPPATLSADRPADRQAPPRGARSSHLSSSQRARHAHGRAALAAWERAHAASWARAAERRARPSPNACAVTSSGPSSVAMPWGAGARRRRRGA